MSTEPGDIKPQLPPASKPTLPPAPKLSLAGGVTKPAFKPDTVVAPSAPVAPAAPTVPVAPTMARPAPATAATLSASRAPVIQAQKSSLASVKAVDDAEVPTWHACLSGFGLVASITAVVLLFLELKPTL